MKPFVRLVLALSLITPATASVHATMAPRGQPIATVCAGPIAAAGRQVAKENDLPLGQSPTACFGRMYIYDEPNFEYLVTAPSPACPGARAINVYGQARAGNWYAFFSKPVCGGTVSIGPKDQWGAWMLTIDGRHYDDRGGEYVQVP